MKALPATKKMPPANGIRLTPSTSAMAAPKLAAAEMPSVNGLASGLLRIVCISAPAMASEAPTTTAISAIGRRISQTMAYWVMLALDGNAMIRATSRMVRPDGPIEMSARISSSSGRPSRPSMIFLRRVTSP